MPEIKNNFLKGRMNQDLDSRILPAGEYREAINLLISRSEGATVGEFENVLGNTNVGTVSSTKALSVIGNFIDKTNNKVYAFATDFSNDDPNSRATSSETCLIRICLTNPATVGEFENVLGNTNVGIPQCLLPRKGHLSVIGNFIDKTVAKA